MYYINTYASERLLIKLDLNLILLKFKNISLTYLGKNG